MSRGRRSAQHSLNGDVVKVSAFWHFVDSGPFDECWEWRGYVNDDGYGEFFWNGKMVGAHELALTFTTGELRDQTLDTCHSCGNRLCCNPSHLRFDTRLSNVADTIRHGRHVMPPSVLNEDQVKIIKLRLAHGAKQKTLAEQFGVTESLISQIKTGKRWEKVSV